MNDDDARVWAEIMRLFEQLNAETEHLLQDLLKLDPAALQRSGGVTILVGIGPPPANNYDAAFLRSVGIKQ